MNHDIRQALGSDCGHEQLKADAHGVNKRSRRAVASAKRIEEIMAAGQRRGLTVTKVLQLPDGTCEVHFGTANVVATHKPKGWGIGPVASQSRSRTD
jgi:hypothetical protein